MSPEIPRWMAEWFKCDYGEVGLERTRFVKEFPTQALLARVRDARNAGAKSFGVGSVLVEPVLHFDAPGLAGMRVGWRVPFSGSFYIFGADYSFTEDTNDSTR